MVIGLYMAVRSSNDTINEITIPEQLPSKCSDEDSESSLSDGLNTVHVEANNIFSDISDAPDDYDTASLSDELIQYNTVSSTHIIKPVCKAIQQVFHCIHAVEYTINHDASCIYTARSILPTLPNRWISNSDDQLYRLQQLIEHSDLLKNILEDYDCEHLRCVSKALVEIEHLYPELITRFNTPQDIISVIRSDSTCEYMSVAEGMNRFQAAIHKECTCREFKEAQRERNRRAQRNFTTGIQYLDTLLKQHSRLLVIRLDLHQPKRPITLAEFKRFHGVFLQKLRRRKKVKLLGYIWKLEYGIHTEFHYHFIFFLDGREHARDILLGQMMGEIWNQVVGENHCYFNCNDPKYQKRFSTSAVGRLERNDPIKYNALLKVIRYFCKKDQFNIHRNCLNTKTFDTGRPFYVKKHMGRPSLKK
jgi:hypothetical protein